MGGVRTSIFGRPRRLPGHRRAATYTVNCEEPLNCVDQVVRVVREQMAQATQCPPRPQQSRLQGNRRHFNDHVRVTGPPVPRPVRVANRGKARSNLLRGIRYRPNILVLREVVTRLPFEALLCSVYRGPKSVASETAPSTAATVTLAAVSTSSLDLPTTSDMSPTSHASRRRSRASSMASHPGCCM